MSCNPSQPASMCWLLPASQAHCTCRHGASRNVSSLPSPSIGSGRPAVTDAHSLTAELNASLQSSSAAATANGLLHDVAAASQPNSFMLEPRPLTTWCTLASPVPLAPAQQPLWDVRGRQGRQAASLPAESGTPQASISASSPACACMMCLALCQHSCLPAADLR